MSLYAQSVLEMKKMLKNLAAWLEKGAAHAKAKSFDAETLLNARLAPDQYPLVRQVQAACDSAKFAAARLSGKTPPAHPDTEKTLAEVHARIASCIAFLDTVTEADFAGAEARMVPLSFMQGKGLRGNDYLVEMATPNFYFHVVTAYAILRHNGVDVGKIDYIGSLNIQDV